MAKEKVTHPPELMRAGYHQYLNKTHEMDQVMQAIIAGIMLEQPTDPLRYIRKCLIKIHADKKETVKVDMFIKKFHPNERPIHVLLTEGVKAFETLQGKCQKEKETEEEFESRIDFSRGKSKSALNSQALIESMAVGPKEAFYLTEANDND